MSKVFICAAIPDEQAIKEEGAVAVATAIEAGDRVGSLAAAACHGLKLPL